MEKISCNMFRNIKRHPAGYMVLFIPLLLFLTTSCAHSIKISPSFNQLNAAGITKIKKNVGYFISPEDLKKQVVTPAGGGDSVKYYPYLVSEPVLKTVLFNIFTNVYSVPALDDRQFITSNHISYIFIPKIVTDSSSRSSWVWPPSDFTVTIDCKAIDSSGNVIWQKEIKGEAHEGLPDVTSDHALAGRVAFEKAFSALNQEILDAEVFK
jgi:hypothetical protein